jgi:septal ring factor EnvC (AmiA/AmiB activator)
MKRGIRVLWDCGLRRWPCRPRSPTARTEANLRSLKERIERIQRQVQDDAAEKDRLTATCVLQSSRCPGPGRAGQGALAALRDQRRAGAPAEGADSGWPSATVRRTNLAAQLRSAYMMGRNEPLKMLLNQRSPAQFQRVTYYGYFGRDRASKINLSSQNIAEIDELARQIEEQDNELEQLEIQRQRRVQELDKARKQRGRVLASLTAESRNRGAQLKRLQQQQLQLEKLLAELRRATEATPFDPNDPFAKLRGRLSWPVAGKVELGYGDTIAGGLRSNGIEIAADRGANVRAVHEGRVIFADWLSGRGLLIILDHGNGYLSLYGHNEQLFKQAGATVRAGETIAAAGDSGGRARPGLYFEIRRAGKPVNPSGWFKSSAPPSD